MFIPFSFLKQRLKGWKKNINLLDKLNCSGLESSFKRYKNRMFLEIIPPFNRPDLFFWEGVLKEISIILTKSLKEEKEYTVEKDPFFFFSDSGCNNCLEKKMEFFLFVFEN